MDNVLYRGTVWGNVHRDIIFGKLKPEAVYVFAAKVTSLPVDAISFAGKHFRDSGSDKLNLPCIIAIDGSYAPPENPDYLDANKSISANIPLRDVRFINPLHQEGIEMILDFVRKHPHPGLVNRIERHYRASFSEAAELYIAERVMPTIEHLKSLVA
ncbi:MAG TPA: hypothetical protein VJH88_02610 [Candidatus Nanoarchaeia archaeon]|nr:hypothetical protein [Candidatus Nanoarchaeia archaeon]